MTLKQMILALTILCATFRAYGAAPDHHLWDELLRAHVVVVRGGQATQVDYRGFATDRAQLKTYLASMTAVSRKVFDAWSKDEQMAFLINAYNAWTIELILTRYPRLESIKDLGSLVQSPWKKRFIPLLGKTMSLDDIEHGWLRDSERYRDPRIHFAVNCASFGCPALRPDAYVAEKLQQQLAQATQLFLADRQRNRIESGRLYVSSIFKWYQEDFARGWQGYTSLQQFLADRGDALGLSSESVEHLRAGAIRIEFLDYDWRLNDTHAKP